MKVHRSSNELQDTIEGYKDLVKMLRAEIQELKHYKSEVIKLENLLQGYKKVIEELSSQVVKK